MNAAQLQTLAALRLTRPQLANFLEELQSHTPATIDFAALIAWFGSDLPGVLASLAKLFKILTT